MSTLMMIAGKMVFNLRWLLIPFCGVILIGLFTACGHIEETEIDDIEVMQESLLCYYNQGVTIDAVAASDSSFVFSLSNEEKISLSKELVFPIDICVGLKDCNDEKVIAVEGYEDWTFSFDDKTTITFGKSLFAVDPDLVVRGINHRGYSVEAPENTLPAFRLSKLHGFRYVETDIHFTKDNVPVLIHDSKVDRTSNGTGEVKTLTWEEIRQFDFGQWKSENFVHTKIPSLEEFLALCRDIGLYPYIELKAGSREQVETVVALVEEYELKGKAVYISFSAPILQYIIAKDPTATVGFLAGTPLTEKAISKAEELRTGSNYVFVDASDYSESAVYLSRLNSMPLETWTIDSESIILSLSPYITGVASNRLHAGRLRLESR